MQLDFNELRELLAAIGQTDIAELTLKSGDLELTVRKATSAGDLAFSALVPPRAGNEAISPPVVVTPLAVTPPPTADLMVPTAGGTSVPTANAAPPSMASDSFANEAKYDVITSPMVGTFYRAIAPGEAPFVEVGDRVRTGQTVCIIEAFKVMNELEAEVSGDVVEILVENGQAVEFGQALMRVKPI